IPVHPNMCKVQCRLSLFAELERCPPIEFPPPADEYSCPPSPGDDPWGFQAPCESIANSHYDMCMDHARGMTRFGQFRTTIIRTGGQNMWVISRTNTSVLL